MARESWLAVSVSGALVTLGTLRIFPPLYTRWPESAPALSIQNGFGYLFGIFPSNLLLTVTYLLTGAWGLIVFRRPRQARFFLRSLAFVYGAFTLLGLLPSSQTIFGLIPIFGANIVLHAAIAAVAAWGGWVNHFPKRESASPGAVDNGSPEPARCVTEESPATGVQGLVVVGDHLIHSFLAPFPFVLLLATLAADLVYWWTMLPWYDGAGPFWARASLWLLGTGLATGSAASVVGLIDFLGNEGVRNNGGSRIHVFSSSLALVLTLFNLLLRWEDPGGGVLPWGIVLSSVTALLLIVAEWSGLALVHQFMIGVPKRSRRRVSWDG